VGIELNPGPPKKGGSKRNKSGLVRSLTVAYRPPMFKPNILLTHKYRFTSTALFSGPITGKQILGSLGTVCTFANTNVRTICSAFRIIKIEAWATPATLGTPISVSINWAGGQYDPPIQISDTSSSNEPAHFKVTPPPHTSLSFWQTPIVTDLTMFNLNIAAGTILDLTVESLIADESNGLSVTVATGTLGAPYYLYLDGGATHLLLPTGLVSTF